MATSAFTIGFLVLVGLGLLFAGLIVVLLLALAFSGKPGGKLAAGVGTAFLLTIVVLCGGFFTVGVSRTTVQSPTGIHSYGEVEYGETVQRARVSTQSIPSEITSRSHVHEIAESSHSAFPMNVSTDTSIVNEPSTKDVTASTGKTIGQFAGSIYQEFRNQLKSGKLDLDPSKIIPPGRPSWVEQEPHWGHDQTYYVSVSSGPYDRGMDCRHALNLEIRKSVDQFAVELTGSNDAPKLIGDGLDTIQEAVATETYQEELTPSFGVMHQWHSLLKFDPAIQEQIRQFWYAQQRISRVVYIGTGFLFLLGVMFIFYAGMSLTSDGSRVSPGLVSAGSVAALCGLLAAGVIFVRSFPML
ncbi:hypothetical protein [Bremerella alba]|uniref:Uncharacterized protein n=1 Tax=Bremerella alba TaxID=980252 RepID=A0A7V9A6Q4_9BACT|nr:hypothetical protein [Bremerella alba]MBA2114605.1 hypothetical protein [Bremerella alba]